MTPRAWNTTSAPASVKPGIAFWNQLLAEHVMELNVSSDGEPREFSADMQEAQMGSCGALMLEARNVQCVDHRCKRARAESDLDTLMLIHMRKGTIDLESDTGKVKLKSDDTVLLADSDRFLFHASVNTRCLVLRVQRGWIKRWIPRINECVGQRINGSTGWGRTASSALHNISPAEIPYWHYPAEDVAEQLASTLSLAVAPPSQGPGRSQQQLFRRAVAMMRQRLGDPELCPAILAKDLGISRRYLHQIFSETAQSFSRTLYELRLEHAARQLALGDSNAASITEIALGSGFSDSGHFSRLFRARYGTTPSQYRAR